MSSHSQDSLPEKVAVGLADWAFSWVGFFLFGIVVMIIMITAGSSTPGSAAAATGNIHAVTSRP